MGSSLRSLSSIQLLAQLNGMVQRESALEADLLAHLGEVDARRLYLREGCSSMFAYCVRVLRFAEAVAYKRIAAARAARRHPVLVDALRRRDLHLTAASLLAPQLTPENAHELVAAARHKTSDEIRRMLADRQPRPEVTASVRRLPVASSGAGTVAGERQPTPGGAAARQAESPMKGGTCSEPSDSASDAASSVPAVGRSCRARASTEALGGERFAVRFTADRRSYSQIQELRALMRHQVPDGDVGEILRRAVAVLLKQVRQQKFGECETPRAAKPAGENASRNIPAAIRRAVSKRDGERCSYVSPSGRRCGAREFLEFHHCDPWAKSHSHPAEGIALRCRAHNQDAAEQDFGVQQMAPFRRGGTELDSDPVAHAGPCPERR